MTPLNTSAASKVDKCDIYAYSSTIVRSLRHSRFHSSTRPTINSAASPIHRAGRNAHIDLDQNENWNDREAMRSYSAVARSAVHGATALMCRLDVPLTTTSGPGARVAIGA